MFRTAKYRPEFPGTGFADLGAARQWASCFVRWYNHEHRHSAIRYVTPAERHAGQDRALLAARHGLYEAARASNPRRWSGPTRDWTPIGPVTLNPERDSIVQMTLSQGQLSSSTDEPAFPPRPAHALAMARSGRDGRRTGRRSHAQHGSPREHGEAGEHRTFPAASTMAGSTSVEGSHPSDQGQAIRPPG